MPANFSSWFWDKGLLLFSRKRRDCSMRVTLVSPQLWQMDTALADQAVLKLMRGPTSTTAAPEPGASRRDRAASISG